MFISSFSVVMYNCHTRAISITQIFRAKIEWIIFLLPTESTSWTNVLLGYDDSLDIFLICPFNFYAVFSLFVLLCFVLFNRVLFCFVLFVFWFITSTRRIFVLWKVPCLILSQKTGQNEIRSWASMSRPKTEFYSLCQISRVQNL